MLRAIAIYRCEETSTQDIPEFTKIKSAQQSKIRLFSEDNELANLEKMTLPLYRDMPVGKICYLAVEDEHHYLKKSSEDKNTVIAIVSRKKLMDTEVAFLLRNINHAINRETVKTSLEAIIANPLNYIGRDILLDKAQLSIDEVKMETQKLIERMLERGEKIEVVEKKSIQLKEAAEKFHDETKKFRRCC